MSNATSFERIFAKRCVICFFIVMLLFFSCILRVAVTAVSDYAEVQKAQSSFRLKAGKPRGTVFDRNMLPLTNSKSKIIAAVSPTPRAVTGISSVLKDEELQSVLERLKSGKPVLCEVPEYIDCDGIACTTVYEHNSENTSAVHLIGYTDSDSRGVSGLEAAYDDLLYSESDISFVYAIDGHGGILEGVAPEIENDTSVIARGVVSTLDINLQNIAEEAADSLETGAVVIADPASSEILACVSRPNFDCTKITDYLDKDDSPLLNRAISAYNVGSVFKPCVAAAGIEAGKGGFGYTCTGSCKIIDRFFKCHNINGHGYMNLKTGLANSCNTFFYNFAFNIGSEPIYNMASSLGFGKKLDICNGISTAKGSIPRPDTLANIAQLANFSIGQGELSLSPISMLTLYCAIASNGTYYNPTAVKGTLSDGALTPYDKGSPTRAMQKSTAALLREYLAAVISEGTGSGAKPQTVSAAGKTATAQTGKFVGGTEICEGWFCGFFPAERPEYVVIVFSENIKRQKLSCAEIFAQIADRITALGVDK